MYPGESEYFFQAGTWDAARTSVPKILCAVGAGS